MATKKRLVIANWKMHPGTKKAAKRLFSDTVKKTKGVRGADIVICPPSIYLAPLFENYTGTKIALGAQDIFRGEKKEGSYTGEVSGAQLFELGVRYVIVGHSERRRMGETDELVSTKVNAALKHRLTPVVCVGERERDSHGAYLGWLENQIQASLKGVSKQRLKQVILAYEPIWAIGKSADEAMTPDKLLETSLFIRKIVTKHYGRSVGLGMKLLYGGSVEPANDDDLMATGHIDGFLVGHASLDAESFYDVVVQ